MATVLHIDSSARPGRSGTDAHGSHTRRLTAHFIKTWKTLWPDDRVIYRDVGAEPPKPVSGAWVHAAFTKENQREPWMHEVLAESNALVDELLAADVIVAGVPMYNFGVPAQFKAYIDNIVRVGRTFGFERKGEEVDYWPMVPNAKKLMLLSSRGDVGYDRDDMLAASNHVEPSVRTPFAYIGITDVWSTAAEYDEYGGVRLQQSLEAAEDAITSKLNALYAESRKAA
ncbi:FMN-dependent NADH-azoreductase [Kordiimonas sp.]|uniref:FMN-dependent NADH-azoreductase n=1 Tax=Kordiimonas sp. TaxID=1970157 RepID=UPI003A9394B1